MADGQALLAGKGLSGNPHEWSTLVDRLGGNGLALKVVGESIRELFGGQLEAFLDEAGSGTLFGGIRRLLTEQIERSSALEQSVLRVLAVEREPVSITQLIAEIGSRVGRGAVLEATESLLRRSLVERADGADTRGHAAFTLQSVVLEYVTDRLVEEVSREIASGTPLRLVRQPIIKAQSKDFVRRTQERLIGAPIVQRVEANSGPGATDQRLLTLLDSWRDHPHGEQGYGPGNVVNLLRLLRGDMRGLDLSHLSIRHAYLQEVEAQDASLAAAHLSETVLAAAFNYPTAVALSADGVHLTVGTSTGEVYLWRVPDRMLLLAVQGHDGTVPGVALSGDGQLVVSGSQDGTIKLWETSTGRLSTTLEGHAGEVWCVALSGDAGLIVSGSQDGIIKLWEASSGRLLATLHGHVRMVHDVALSSNGQLVASGSQDGTVKLWETTSGRLLRSLEGHAGPVFCVALSSDARLLASGSTDGTARLWDASNGRLLMSLDGHTSGVRCVALSGDGRLVASGGWDRAVKLWEASSGRLLATLHGHSGTVEGVALSGDGRLVATGSWHRTANCGMRAVGGY